MYSIIEVKNEKHENDFISFPDSLYKNDKNYVKPFIHDIVDVFKKEKNKAFRDGEITRFILYKQDEIVGRIAVFTNDRNYGKMEQPTGGIGFFDCIDDQLAANVLFETARKWLESHGCEAMDGPNNFGEKDKWWGLLINGFYKPTYGMNYNFPYYKNLFENYGFKIYYEQYVFAKSTVKGTTVPVRTQEKYELLKNNTDYHFEYIKGNDLNKYAQDFCDVYNAAWGKSFKGFKAMEIQQAQKIMRAMKPIMDKKLMWFGYHRNKAIAMFIAIPDLNEVIRYINGEFSWYRKIEFIIRLKWLSKPKTAVGIVFGVSPAHQGKGVDGAIQYHASQYYYNSQYDNIEMTWIGEFNPKMINMVKGLECELYKTYATYRYLFDREKPFTKHPILN